MKNKLVYYIGSFLFTIALSTFYTVRLPDILADASGNVMSIIAIVVSFIGTITIFFNPPPTLGGTARRFGLIILVFLQLKQKIDQLLPSSLPNLENRVVIVTGANSGIGFEVAALFALQNATVIMACRDVRKCNIKADEIRQKIAESSYSVGVVDPMVLDLADLVSVRRFVEVVKKNYSQLDYLINNAGLVSESGYRTAQGFEGLLGTMHLGHFSLTKWLEPLLLRPPNSDSNSNSSLTQPARVINVASDAFIAGNFHPSLMTDDNYRHDWHGELTDNCPTILHVLSCCPALACPHTNGYARAKLANILHAMELQKHFEAGYLSATAAASSCTSDSDSHSCSVVEGRSVPARRRVVTASLHPGVVWTNIHFMMMLLSPILRPANQAAAVVLHATFDDGFVPGSYIDGMKHPHYLGDVDLAKKRHVNAYWNLENIRPKPAFLRNYSPRSWSVIDYMWQRMSLIAPLPDDKRYDPAEVAARLWKVSDEIIEQWMEASKL